MSSRITEKDNPDTIQERAKYYEDLLEKALPIAKRRVNRQPLNIKKMVNAARFEGMVPGYKSLSVAFPSLNSNSSWCVIYPWSHLEDFSADEVADYIIDTVKRYVDEERKKK